MDFNLRFRSFPKSNEDFRELLYSLKFWNVMESSVKISDSLSKIAEEPRSDPLFGALTARINIVTFVIKNGWVLIERKQN